MVPTRWTPGAALLAAALLAACAGGTRTAGAPAAPAVPPSAGEVASGGLTPAEQARRDGGRPPFTAADVAFMQAMIGHHAQALVMARMAPSHGASPSVRTLAGRIDVSQADEIDLMRRWLTERGREAPDPAAAAHHAAMGHATHDGGPMPGMLGAEELARLDAARGAEFDRLFLTYMIRHHEGAVEMVRRLFAARGAGQDITVFRFASDVEADQTTEIERMRLMLAALDRR